VLQRGESIKQRKALMKMIVCSLLFSSSTLFTMEEQIESELKKWGLKFQA
jgi:hypothetical protein